MKRHGFTKQTAMLLAFVFPALLFYAAFVLVPAFGGVWYSLTDWNGLSRSLRFVGLDNYIEIASNDPNFLKSILFTMKYVVFIVVLQNVIALLLAALVESLRRGRALFRTIFYLPNMISMIIGGFIWLFLFTRVFPHIAASVPQLGFLDRSWIGDPSYSFLAILIVSIWGGVGYLMIIYIAALQGVPQQLKESAAIDGAGAFRTFFQVTLPMIAHAMTIGVFLALSSSFKVFDVVYAMTGGGPGRSTEVIALNIFQEAFANSNRYGYASAKAMVLFLIIFVITLVQLRFMKRREVEL